MLGALKKACLMASKSVDRAAKGLPFTVLVEGNIGSGKTTLIEYFESSQKVCVLSEPIEQWRCLKGHNMLALMYSDQAKWGFSFQSYVQLTMLKAHLKQSDRPIKLMERSIYSARYCFVEKMLRDGNLSQASVAVLDEWFDFVTETMKVPADLIVYLRTTPEVVHRRMMERNRSEEQCVPLEYLQGLHELHEDWLVHEKTFPAPAPVITIDADSDLASVREQYEKFKPHLVDLVPV